MVRRHQDVNRLRIDLGEHLAVVGVGALDPELLCRGAQLLLVQVAERRHLDILELGQGG